MQRVEAIKQKRSAQFIFDRQRKARDIERAKDRREVHRDMALIKSPAAGLKRPGKQMEDEQEVDMEDEQVRQWSPSLVRRPRSGLALTVPGASSSQFRKACWPAMLLRPHLDMGSILGEVLGWDKQ